MASYACPTLVGDLSDLSVSERWSFALTPARDYIYIENRRVLGAPPSAGRVVRGTLPDLALDPSPTWYDTGDTVSAPADSSQDVSGVEVGTDFVYWMERANGVSVPPAPGERLMRAALDGSGVTTFITPSGSYDNWAGDIQRDPGSDRFYVLDYLNENLAYFTEAGDFQTVLTGLTDVANRLTVTPDGAVWLVQSVSGQQNLTRIINDAIDFTEPMTGSFSSAERGLIPRPDNSVMYLGDDASATFYRMSPSGAETSYTCTSFFPDSVPILRSSSFRTYGAVYFITDGGSGRELWVIGPDVTPPLRQRQRDDTFNTPRVALGSRNAPKSLQESIRQGHSNTYL